CAWYGMCMFSQRTQVLLSPAQLARLKRIATQERRSVGAVIRDAVDAYTSETTTAEERRAALEHLLSLNAPVDDWTVMKRQIEESRYPPVEGLP
ncbi:MAG TPA: CopG family transcriptional regulator, partial [Candidatus Limnocylindrales bacterium]